MNKKIKKDNKIMVRLFIVVSFLFFVAIILRIAYLSLSTEVDGINLQEFASSRTTRLETLYAKRGTIYASNGEVLAQNVSSYTLIAYLSEKRTTDPSNPQHVVDKEYTAEKLSKILNMDYDKVLYYLKKDNVYQTEFGSKGRGITELTKSEIEDLNLPGIDFIETQKRNYPFGTFLSYTLGYAKINTIENEDGSSTEKITGEMGIEAQYDSELSGKDGYTYYQKDRNGYKIAGTDEITEEQVNGQDIYLTIDSNVQLFVEQALTNMNKKTKTEWTTFMVADAKTGAILASASTPTFDPNTRENIPTYYDHNISYAFEPGSTMKTYTYMAVMENGNYNGKETYKSGTYVTKDGTEIGDWDRKGWGVISYDKGYTLSSNVGVINLIKKKINGNILKDYFLKLGFGSKTGIELANEKTGKVAFKYETEILNAGFGQGITTTPIQHIKALTSISNNGTLLQPYIIKKIVDPNTNEVVYEGKKTELETVASQETVDTIKDLMYRVVNERTGAAGSMYKMNGYNLIGKTGTAQVAKENGKGYSDSTISSFAGMFPKDDPEVIIYIAAKDLGNLNAMVTAVKDVVKNVSNYLNIYNESTANVEKLKTFEIESYINKNTESTISNLKENEISYVKLGTGSKITNQYPSSGTTITELDKVFLLTNSNEINLPNIKGWSSKDVRQLANLININVEYQGSGYVKTQSIKENAIIKKNEKLTVILEQKK